MGRGLDHRLAVSPENGSGGPDCKTNFPTLPNRYSHIKLACEINHHNSPFTFSLKLFKGIHLREGGKSKFHNVCRSVEVAGKGSAS